MFRQRQFKDIFFFKFCFRCLDFQLDNPSDAIEECNEALKIDENDVDALCDRAEAHILNEMYDEGTKNAFFNLFFSCSIHQCFSFIRFTADIYDSDLR